MNMESKLGGEMEEELYDDRPVSPTGQYFSSSAISVSILGVLEVDTPVNESHLNDYVLNMLQNIFLPINPRFSSVMVTNKYGVKQWKSVTVNLEDHVRIPIFPEKLTTEAYDVHTQDYMSKIAMEQLPLDRPLWELHIIKYPSSNAAGVVIFKLHHALGDGYSIMGALLSCLKRADDPSLPLTFPSTRTVHTQKSSKFKHVVRLLPMLLNTTVDFMWSLLKSTVVVDDKTPIRSATDRVELRPITLSTTTFSLDRIKIIKSKLGGSVNHIVVGTIFYGIRLYMQSLSKASNKAGSTALVLLNTREINGYRTVEEMKKPNTVSSWGNQFAFLPISIPKSNDLENSDPLKFISKAQKIIKRSKKSLAVYLTGRLLEMIRKSRGPETAGRYISKTLRNTSMAVSSMIGPIEKISIGDYPCSGMYYMVVNGPQSLMITFLSYMGNLRVAVGAEKDYIDHKLLISCLDTAFQKMFDAALAI